MMCPVCKRDLAATLSICFACGAMVNDSVREELETKIGRVSGRLERPAPATAAVIKMEKPAEPASIRIEIETAPEPPSPRQPRGETKEFGNKKTSPTLVGFQPKTSTVPDWRLQLQNSIRQRKTDVAPSAPPVSPAESAPRRQAIANAAVAVTSMPSDEPEAAHENPRVAAALQRIEVSRRRFMEPSASVMVKEAEAARPAARNFPFNVVSRSGDFSARADAPQATVNTLPKPRLVTSA